MKPSVWIQEQKKVLTKEFTNDHLKHVITVVIRYDDQCGNGHNTFSITGTVDYFQNGRRHESMGGCIHEEIVKRFPELEKYIKWHGCSSDGPMHYIANTLFLAGDADCHGRKKGEASQWDDSIRFKGFPIRFRDFPDKFIKFIEEKAGPDGDWFRDLNRINPRVMPVEHAKDKTESGYKFGPKYTFDEYPCEWYQAPFDTFQEASEFLDALQHFTVYIERIPTAWSDGKEREFTSARSVAIWPEATDEQLSLPKEELKKLLEARLPALLEEFKAAMEEIGFTF